MTIRQTDVFRDWIRKLRDERDQARINVRIRRLSLGNAGDGVSELRIDYGPGYRVYFTQQGVSLIILLAGGDKRTQDVDIETAKALARGLED
jgi:putative addiction module killer protein